jgi:FAD-dependent urate hydroxylase
MPHMPRRRIWVKAAAWAVEDALLLAQELREGDTIQTALQTYEARRRPRINWVQEQSLAAARVWGLPPAVRDSVLGEHGDQALPERYEPLRAEP